MSTSPKPSSFVTTFTSHRGFGFLSGQLPRKDGELMYRGKAGAENDLESARAAAKLSAEACIQALDRELGGRDRLLRVLKITGFVASAPGFNLQPQVIDAASEVFVSVLGSEVGAHARSAIGVAELPHNACVEIEVVVAIS